VIRRTQVWAGDSRGEVNRCHPRKGAETATIELGPVVTTPDLADVFVIGLDRERRVLLHLSLRPPEWNLAGFISSIDPSIPRQPENDRQQDLGKLPPGTLPQSVRWGFEADTEGTRLRQPRQSRKTMVEYCYFCRQAGIETEAGHFVGPKSSTPLLTDKRGRPLCDFHWWLMFESPAFKGGITWTEYNRKWGRPDLPKLTCPPDPEREAQLEEFRMKHPKVKPNLI